MDVRHPIHHGKHRRRRRQGRILVVGLCLLVLAGGVVAALALDRGPTSSNAGQRAGPAPSAATEHAGHSLPDDPTSSPAPPPQSAATPGEGSVVAVGKTPHDVAVSPDGTFAYIADPGAGAVIRFDTAGSRPTATIPVPEAPPQMVTFSPDGSRAFVSAFEQDFTVNYV